MFKATSAISQHEKAQSLIEYVLILALFIILAGVGLHLTGVNTDDLFHKIGAVFGISSHVTLGDPTSEPTENPNIVYAEDDFSDLDDWKKIFGPHCWSTTGGILSVARDSCSSVLLHKTTLPDDYTYTMGLAQLNSGNGYGLMFRLLDQPGTFSGYSFQVDPGYGNQFVFRRFDRGAELQTPLAWADFPPGFDVNAPHQVSVKVVGDTLTASIDGVQVLSATDNTYTSGGAGLRTWGSSQASFDDFSVTSP